MHGRYPAYLMLAFDAPVRFEGKGYYVLLPKATAAFGISHFFDRTRAVIPLYGQGVPQQGALRVRPLQAGMLNVQWAVVGHNHCREIVASGGRGSATILVESTGAPEIVVNPFARKQPTERIFSPAGNRIIDVYNERYRLVDAASGSEIAERAGRHPRFSPTGRYIAAYTEDGIEILDTVDGKTVHKERHGVDLAWDDADSFAIVNRGTYGSVAILAPSRSEPVVLEGTFGCHACFGTDSVALRVDLENNVAVAVGADDLQGSAAASLTTPAKIPATINEIPAKFAQITAFVRRQSQVTRFALPKRWELHGGLKFSNLAYAAEIEEHPERSNDRFQNLLMRFLVKPIVQPAIASRNAGLDAVKVALWRAIVPKAKEVTDRNIFKRLSEFGLPIPEQAQDEGKARFTRTVMTFGDSQGNGMKPADRARMSAIVRRIEQRIPSAADIFVTKEKGDLSDCLPERKGKRYGLFQKAFRFQAKQRVIWMSHYECTEGSGHYDYSTLLLFDSTQSKPWILSDNTGDGDTSSSNTCDTEIALCDFDARIFGDRFLLLSSAQSRAIEIYDLDKRRNIFKKYKLPRGDLLKQALLSPNGKLVLQINSDGSFAGFRTVDAKQLFEGRYVDDEIVVWTPDGRFDATSEGANFVSLRLPGRVGTYTFAQFSARLRTPGLVKKLLAGETFPPITLVAPPSLSGKIDVRGAHIHGTARAVGDTPLASLLVYQDGLLTNRLAAAGKSASWKFDVDLLKGTRWVSMVAVDQAGLASLPMGRDLPQAQALPHRVHVLAIGINDYTDPLIPDLDLARADAQHFAKAVAAIGHDVVVASNRILNEKQATREGVLSALRQIIARAAPGESVMLLFAGHGVRGDDGNYYLATSDTRIDNIAGTALPWKSVAEILAKSRTRIALFLDTCHSGAAGTSAYSTNDAAAKSLLERIPSGIVVFSASKGRELSEESPTVGGGVFTSAVVKVIAGDRARYDTNKDHAIEISELYRGVKNLVSTATASRQNSLDRTQSNGRRFRSILKVAPLLPARQQVLRLDFCVCRAIWRRTGSHFAGLRSVAKMKAVQPQMAALKERYPDDKVKQQQELMALYKKEKIPKSQSC